MMEEPGHLSSCVAVAATGDPALQSPSFTGLARESPARARS